MKVYAAYGSNLNRNQMARRCPGAVPIGTGYLNGWRLEFRGVLTIVEEPGSSMEVGLWVITDGDEESLDIYEGYPKLYRKEQVSINHDGKQIQAMTYIMNQGTVRLPSRGYWETCIEGAYDFGISDRYLKDALKRANQLETAEAKSIPREALWHE